MKRKKIKYVLYLTMLGMLFLCFGCSSTIATDEDQRFMLTGKGVYWQAELAIENSVETGAFLGHIHVRYLGRLTDLADLENMSLGLTWLHEDAEFHVSEFGFREILYHGDDREPLQVSETHESFFTIYDDIFEPGEYSDRWFWLSQDCVEQITGQGSTWVIVKWFNYKEEILVSLDSL